MYQSYQSIEGILSKINYAHAGSRRSIEYLVGNPVMFQELGPYNKKFGMNVPIGLKPIIYEIADSPYEQDAAKHYTPNTATLHQHYYFTPETFLRPGRKPAQFVGEAEQIKDMITEAFKAAAQQGLPENISIQLCTIEEMIEMHSPFGSWHPGIMGFSLNANGNGTSHIFVRKGPLDSVMVTIGHELGHVFTKTLENSKDEEAKAFAFCLAWVEAIKENNIGNLADSITGDIQPAENNLHDVAFNFVKTRMAAGMRALELHWDIVKQYASLARTMPHYAR
ncbi:hypothetical protein HYV81_02455 [Candidatus Woesearchaeota archaeon]|nr:hypothetical protein [Candidatus Woesearchaeota archaeon]